MSTTSLPTSGSPAPPTTGGTTLRPFKAPSKSKSDWLAPAILTAKTITAAAECAPFPYIKGVSGTVLILLETVVTVKKNREDLEELCNSATKIITILHDQVKSYGNTAAVKFKDLCEELESYLEAVILAIRNMQDQSKGFRGRVQEFLKSSSLTDEIAGYQTQIQGLMAIVETNFKVDEMHAIITAPSFTVVKAVENINDCPPPSRIFQGRQAILDKMHQFFNTDSGNQHIYVLYGLGGAGKTQIALKFIEQLSFSDVFLVDTSKVDTIETGLKSIAVSKNVYACLSPDWPKVWPFESRAFDLRELIQFDVVKLPGGITMLVRSQELYYLPLAIVQAGAFISKSEDLEGYLDLYLNNRARLLSEKAAQSHDDYAQTVFTTWQISFNQLSHLAATLLQLCSFLHYTGISEDMFSTASKYDFSLSWPPREELQEPLEFLSHFVEPTGEWNSLKFLDVTNEIKAYSLISFDAKAKLFSIHPLVHAWSRSTLLDEEPLQSCMSSILGMCIKKIPENEMELASVRLISHVGLLKYANPDRVADFRRAFSQIYYYTGKFKDAQALAELILERSKLLLGDDHADTLSAMGNLASTYFDLGESLKAKELEVLVLEKRTKILGEDHPDTLLAMGSLASTYYMLGEFQKAKELELLALEKHTKVLGEDHPRTLLVMGNLASIYSDLGEFQKAKKLDVLVLEKHTKTLGEDHPDTLFTLSNLAITYYTLGEFQKAKEIEVLVLEKRTKVLGMDHPNTLRAMANLAVTYYTLGDLNKALGLEVEVLQKRKQLLGNKHPDTILAMENLVKTYQNLGKREEVEEVEQLIEDTKKSLQCIYYSQVPMSVYI
ncbi:hypothetical protein B0H16DRAFT_1900648 [Mycena metata]|uniref:DUF7779 domain-containing protein n=1 Tax=Mycena metata TaxID=1033252 RepID=A0AAD7H3F3_9AGAR|nr:hypothetical protein B0H16DRAFT_1900648 [Mycena metata]